jgi:hypothetical protein
MDLTDAGFVHVPELVKALAVLLPVAPDAAAA